MAKKIPFVFATFNYDGLTHAQRICRLYRATLTTIHSYMAFDDDKQRRDMCRVRYLLDGNKDVKDPRKQLALYEEWVGLYEEYKHNEPVTHPECPEGTAYNRQVYFPIDYTVANAQQSWWIKEWQLDRNISGLKEWEWDKRPEWRNLVTRNHRRAHIHGYEDDV